MKKRYALKTILYVVLTALGVLSPANVICYLPALLLAVHLCSNGRHLLAAIAVPVCAVMAMLGFNAGVALFLVTATPVCIAAMISLKRGFATGKISLVCSVTYGISLIAGIAAVIYINGGSIDADIFQRLYETVKGFIASYAKALEGIYAGVVTEIEKTAYSITASIPGYVVMAASSVGILSGLAAAASRPGERPVMAQLKPEKRLAVIFFLAAIASGIASAAAAADFAGDGKLVFFISAHIITSMLLPLFAVCGIEIIRKQFSSNNGRIFIILLAAVLCLFAGILNGMAYIGAYFTVARPSGDNNSIDKEIK